jgi:hypothetical protein
VLISFASALSSGLCENRRKIVKNAQGEGFSHILWIDDDMTFPANTLDRLMDHKLPIVGCNCTTRRLPVKTTAILNDQRIPSTGQHGLQKVDGVGFGVLLTETAIFERLPEPWFATPFDPNAKPGVSHFLTEDLWFCCLARRFGFDVWIDHDLSQEIGHIGDYEFNHGLSHE